jgi:hypothetical protein
MVELIQESQERRHTHVTMTFAKIAVCTVDNNEIPQLHFDQLCHLNQLHIALRAPTNEANDAILNFARTQLRKCPDYDQWRQSEWQQRDKYALENMFGSPIRRPEHAIVLPFVWNYSSKEDPILMLQNVKLGEHATEANATVRQLPSQKPMLQTSSNQLAACIGP